jgi:polyisoprenoid-binding protein YceI
MRFLLALILLFFAPGAFAAESGGLYYVPPGQFTASMQVMNLGLANIIGLFGNATGSFTYDDQAKSISNLRLAVDATSLVSSNSENQNALANLLDVSQYQEIRFTALDAVTFADNKASIKGTLTFQGVSKPVTLDATINSVGKAPRGHTWAGNGEALGLSMHGSFKRADFGVAEDPNVPGRFGDTITLQLEMQAVRQ